MLKPLYVNNTLYPSSQLCKMKFQGTNPSTNFTFLCNNTFELDEPSQEPCVIMHFGIYKYKQLLMGLKFIPDFAQQVMEEVSCYIKNVDIFVMTFVPFQ